MTVKISKAALLEMPNEFRRRIGKPHDGKFFDVVHEAAIEDGIDNDATQRYQMHQFAWKYVGLIENIVNDPKSHNATTMIYAHGGMDVLGAMVRELGSAELQTACEALDQRVFRLRIELEQE